jgi:hypothetical protein
MIGRAVVAIAMVASVASSSSVQKTTPASVAEPRFINSFYGLGDSGTLIELERKAVKLHTKVRAFPGYASYETLSKLNDARSPVRLAPNARFVVRGRSALDPTLHYQLRRLKSGKRYREFIVNRGHGTVFAGAATADESAIAIRFEDYGMDSYRITPEQPLAPGEYALAVRGSPSEVYCFGVDK